MVNLKVLQNDGGVSGCGKRLGICSRGTITQNKTPPKKLQPLAGKRDSENLARA